MRTFKRKRTHAKTRRYAIAWRRGGVVVTLLALASVLMGVAFKTNGGERERATVAANVEKSDAFPFLFANGDARIAPTTVAGNYVNGRGERLDPVAPEQDSLMAMTPAELGANPAEFAEVESARYEEPEYAEDELDWGAVGEDPEWRQEIALFENDCVRFKDAQVVVWSAHARMADNELALNSDIFDNLHCATLLNQDGLPAYPSFADAPRVFSSNTSNVVNVSPDAPNVAVVEQVAPEAPLVNASATGYYAPRPTAWTSGAAYAGSTSRALVN